MRISVPHRPRPSPATVTVLLALPALLALLAGGGAAQEPYAQPPQPIAQILDAPPLPDGLPDPAGDWLLLLERRSMPSIEDLARPMLRLAGVRINPATNGVFGAGEVVGLLLKGIEDGAEKRIELPAGARVDEVYWAPAGGRFAFTVVRDDGMELWTADAATGAARRLTPPILNGVGVSRWGGESPCEWMPDGSALLCQVVAGDRGPAPREPAVPAGPVIQQSRGEAAPVWTYQDLLEDAHDEALFRHYFSAELVLVDAATGERTRVADTGIYRHVQPSPDGRFVLVERTVEPFSYLVPWDDFAREIEVLDLAGRVVRTVASQPVADNVPRRGVRTGPRAIGWRPTAPATLVWTEATDGGDPDRDVEHRDRVMLLSAPFAAEPVEWLRLADRLSQVYWGEGGLALVSDYDRALRRGRTWIADADRPAASPELLWDRSTEDVYGDPGRFVTRAWPAPRISFGGGGLMVTGGILVQRGSSVYLTGEGASPEGERPFLDRLDLESGETERLWRSAPDRFEMVVALLDDRARQALMRGESRTQPPNYYAVDVRQGRARALTSFEDPAPQLSGIEKQMVTYTRDDGVPLSGELYLPPGYRPGTPLPVLVWAYPREFASADAAGQVRTSPNRFTLPRGASHLFLLTQGYAVLDNAAMPIIGGDTANNTYVEQLVASARAAVRKVVDMGVADPDRIGVAGHSYGAFMTANLLAHSDLFRAGIARSGAYNRTLTPFGFQNETRFYWQAPEIYFRMSPFMNADKVDEPILLIHGMADNNSGTFPVQSERFFHALNGLGATARLVMLPHESHGYAARESVLHALAEMISWMDRHVKDAPPRAGRTTS